MPPNLTKPASGGDNVEAASKTSGEITADSNVLRTIGGVALLVFLVPALAGFVYLKSLREPALQVQQVDRMASSFVLQKAANIAQVIAGINTRLRSAAQSPLALFAIASGSDNDIAQAEQGMLYYFPEALSLKLIPISDMGTATFSDSLGGLRNHIEVDLVRRASKGEQTEAEAYQFEDQWITSIAAQASHASTDDRQAVIIVSIENKVLWAQLETPNNTIGKFILEQKYITPNGQQKVDAIASSGNTSSEPSIRHYADVQGAPWRVSFSPSTGLIQALSANLAPLYFMLALVVLAAVAAISIILIFFPKRLSAQISNIISTAHKKSPLVLEVPELLRYRAAPRSTAQHRNESAVSEVDLSKVDETKLQNLDLSKPLFQPDNMPDENDKAPKPDLADEIPTEAVSRHKKTTLPEHIFRAYDIRGHAESELTDEVIASIAGAIGTIAEQIGEHALIVACDGRTSSPRIKAALIHALLATGRDVIDIGMTPTPLLYFATQHLSCRSGIMVTGSHNPAEQNGLKIVLGQQTIAAGRIADIRDRAEAGDFSSGNGRLTQENVIPAYLNKVLGNIAIASPLTVVVDAGNGATSEIAPKLFQGLGCEVVRLNCQVNGQFPGHPPDTSNEENLAMLASKVVDVQANFGVAFDGDGDRLVVISSDGEIVWPDRLMMIFARDILARNPGADIVFDVKSSKRLGELITDLGGHPIWWKTGHAFMKEKMQETGALLGGEFSGHMFFGDRWYGFDDGMYAASRLAEIISAKGVNLDDAIAKFPATINTPEIIIPVPDDDKFALVTKLIAKAQFPSGKVTTLDGLRVDFSNGWGLVRASNTGPALTARFEADTQENLSNIQEEFRTQIAQVDPAIELNF